MTKKQGTNPVENIEWVSPDTLWANDYNPNHVAKPELKLLKVSLMMNGWALPIVVRPDGEIVDGFHRWNLAITDKEINALADGLVPVVRLPVIGDRAHQIAATVQFNRARGTHYVLQMAHIVNELLDMGMTDVDVAKQLGMEMEEVRRMNEYGNMKERGSSDSFGKGWAPGYTHKEEEE